ncbi:uncharacterized protein LOC123504415 [Portunus trituberculatus]|uniref:uncharacterized protein LOC123504415 n=1 Tax=Portunus trituberculatus TaxID=210409 RepID=UPI001E1CBB78|nr:uncharacterized protein LOC123504415 [Portunus trituberculatus]XP_045110860.1 uncharacterized protein LOC123504415 [Portunus trituberculatus]XP_045110861.1 uncharacterized protein LOC123504415 [Portunus trituberculatus]XP_045110862.1 uncharacterized protein LOC123504415 [Portunus trituberculatus]
MQTGCFPGATIRKVSSRGGLSLLLNVTPGIKHKSNGALSSGRAGQQNRTPGAGHTEANMYLAAAALTVLIIVTDFARAGAGLQLYEGDGCLNRCIFTSYYSPVCGTDYITYLNPSSLRCWKRCHYPELAVAHFSTCIDWITGQNQT